MEDKKDKIYSSSNEALIKFFVLLVTLGISIIASLCDYKACYTAILLQSCNNMYDFYQYADNKKYTGRIRGSAIAVILASIIAFIGSIIAILSVYSFTKSIWMKLIMVLLVAFPLFVVYNDCRINVHEENS